MNRYNLLETVDSEPVPSDTIWNKRSPSITLRVTLVGRKSGREISAKALLDSGADGIIIDHDFAKRNNLTLQTLVHPIPVRNVNGTLNKQGAVTHTTIQTIWIKSQTNDYHKETSELYVTSLGDHNLIFGTDWLKAHNPDVDWATPCLTLSCCPTNCKLTKIPMIIDSRNKQHAPLTIGQLHPDENKEPLGEPNCESIDADTFIQFHQFYKPDSLNVWAKITHSTETTAWNAPKPSIEHIPEEFCQYAKVFDEQSSYQLPAHRPWDHAIELIPNAPPWKRTSIYSLTPLAPHAAYVLQYNMGTIPKMHYNKSGMTPCPTKVAIRTFGWGKMM